MKENLVNKLIKLRGEREYWRVKYNQCFFFDGEYLAKLNQCDAEIEEIVEQLSYLQ